MGSEITVVSGLPRTGTSMMMKMLAAGGMDVVSDDVRQADIDNPGGYYELESVKNVKEDSSWLQGARGKAFKMVSMLLYELPPGFRYRIIFMERDISEVLVSQDKMLKRLGRDTADGPEGMGRLYGKHLAEIKDWLGRQENMDVLYVSYNKALEDPRGIAEAVNRFLGDALDTAKMAGVIDEALYRNRAAGQEGAGGGVGSVPLEEKVARALELIRGQLGRPGKYAVGFGGGKDSVVLLHLVRRTAGDGPSVPVLCLDPPSVYPGLYHFIEKVRRLWGLDLLRCKVPPPPSHGEPLPWQGIYPGLAGLVEAASIHGFAGLFTGLRADEEGVAGELQAVQGCGPVMLFNPLSEFTGSDVSDYIREHRLPSCSLYTAGTGKLRCLPGSGTAFTGGAAREEDAGGKRVRTNLAALGYM